MSPVRTSAAEPADTPVPDPRPAAVEQPRRRGPTPGAEPSSRLVVAGVFVALALPLLVAAATLRRPQWYPVLDLAMTELRLRDVGTSHTPLIGLPGRIGPSLAEQGSHPGPLSFYLLAPFYRAFGSSAWAMQLATIVVNLAAIGTALAVAARRGGSRLVLAVGAVLALLTAGYGLTVLTQPWNPYLPLLWWIVLLLAVWSVLCDDVAMLPVAVLAASLCAQTHVPYLGLALGLGAVACVAVIVAWRRAAPGSASRRHVARWCLGSLALALVLWLPPVIDQAVNDPGNLRAIYDHLGTPVEEPVGFARGVELALSHLDVAGLIGAAGDAGAAGSLLEASSGTDGSVLPGLAVLAVWAAAALVALRSGSRALVRLHLVVAAALVLGVVALARIFGKEWYYLMLWAWGVTALLLLAVGWTALSLLRSRVGPGQRRHLATAVSATLLALVVVGSGVATADAVGVDPPEPHLSSALGALLPGTIAALERGEGAATGRDGRYVVTWNDALYFGSQGYGLASELQRAGFRAGLPPVFHVPITDHRVIGPDEATADVVLAVGGENVARWRTVADAAEVAHVEPRDAAARAEFAGLRSAVIDDLRGDGLDDVVPVVDGNLFGASIDPRVSPRAERLMARMLELGEPGAVFIVPPGTTP